MNISNLIANAANLSADGEFSAPVVEEKKKTPRDFVPAEERWLEDLKKKDEKRKTMKIKIELSREATSIAEEVKKFKAKKATETSTKSSAKSVVVEKATEPKVNVITDYQGILNKNIVGMIDHKQFLDLASDLRSLLANEFEPGKMNPNSINRMKQFCQTIGFDYDTFISLERTKRSSIVLDAYIGYSPNIALGLQITSACDLACANTNVKMKIDYVSRIQSINAFLARDRSTNNGPNYHERADAAKVKIVSWTETDPTVKSILNYSGRARVASMKVSEMIATVGKADYQKNLVDFKKSVAAMITWIVCEKVLKLYEDEIKSRGYTEFVSKEASTYLAVCKMLGFNAAQSTRILIASDGEAYYDETALDKLVKELYSLENVTIVNESGAFAKMGEVFKFNKNTLSV